MRYDFDELVERRQTESTKYDAAKQRGKPEGLLPLWVADMDFAAPHEVIEALKARCEHGIFGYCTSSEAYDAAIVNWFQRHHNWQIDPAWITKTPGVVFAVACAIRALTREGDAVLVQQPAYYPFMSKINSNGRKLIINRLVLEQGRYAIDFEDFEKKIADNDVKLFILCNPHNPVGRVWSRQELEAMGDICQRHGVTVLADEIHADFVYPPHVHTVFASIKPSFADHCVTFTAPSKTFNLAGLQISNIVIANDDLRSRFRAELDRTGASVGIMGVLACRVAYETGDEWLSQLMVYLKENVDFLRDFLQRHLPIVSLVEPEGTYLCWLDFSRTGLVGKQLDDFILHEAGLWLDDGEMFGSGGEGFQRINIACPRSTLKLALKKLAAAINGAD